MSEITTTYKKIIFTPWFAYGVLVLLHLIVNHQVSVMLVPVDEGDYLAQARFLAGGLPLSLTGMPYVHFAYSLFLLPLFWIYSNIGDIHYSALIINALLISSLFWPLYYIARNILALAKSKAIFLSGLTCLFPSFFTHGAIIWSENLAIPLLAFYLVLFWLFLQKQSYYYATLLGIFTAALYATHPRFLSLIIIMPIFLLIIGYKRKKIKLAIVSLIGLTLTTLLVIIFNQYLSSVSWGSQGYFQTNPIEAIFHNFRSWKSFLIYPLITLGHWAYLTLSTLGLFLVGVYYIFKSIQKSATANNDDAKLHQKKIWLLYMVCCFLGVYLSSVLFFSGITESALMRADFIIYGRHTESFIAIFLLFGIYYFVESKLGKSWPYYLILASLPLIIHLLDVNQILLGRVSPYNIAALTSYITLFYQYLDLRIISAIVILIFFLLRVFKKLQQNLPYVLIALVFSFSIYSNFKVYTILVNILENKISSSLEISQSLTHNSVISIDTAYRTAKIKGDFVTYTMWSYNYYHLQLKNPQLKFYSFNSDQGQSPPTDYFIADKNANINQGSLKMIAADEVRGIYLWQKATSTAP